MITQTAILGTLGILAGLTTAIVEVIKQILPKSVPTKIVTIIIAFLVTMVYVLVTATAIIPMTIVYAIAESFIVAYLAMFGFDSLKDIFKRFQLDKEDEE